MWYKLRWEEDPHVHNREDVEIVLVDKALDLGAGRIVGEQVVRDVLADHGRDPLSGMHRCMDDDGRLGSLARSAVEVDAGDWPALQGVSDLHDLGVRRIGGLQVGEELQVVGVGVVGVEPC